MVMRALERKVGWVVLGVRLTVGCSVRTHGLADKVPLV